MLNTLQYYLKAPRLISCDGHRVHITYSYQKCWESGDKLDNSAEFFSCRFERWRDQSDEALFVENR